jgi:hypothetical protein
MATPASALSPFVPWGWMPKPFQDAMPIPGHPRFQPSGDWLPWLERTADELKAFLWPRWRSGAWDGDLGLASRLTAADLALMASLTALLTQPVGPAGPTHEELFLKEDAARPSLDGLRGYLPSPPQIVVTNFDRLLSEGGQIGEGAAIELKQRMQRPRPYQTAFLLDPARRFEYRVATTAVTPSLVSGHALQGAMALANVVVRLEHLQGTVLEPSVLEQIERYFIHIGDRRVMAGVHYPTDNVSSWYTVLRLCRHVVFDTPEDPINTAKQQLRARTVLWEAVVRHSPVWQALLEAAAFETSPYGAVIARLRAETDG